MGFFDELGAALGQAAAGMGNFNNNISLDEKQQLQFAEKMEQLTNSGVLSPEMTDPMENGKAMIRILEEIGADKTPDTSLGKVYPEFLKALEENNKPKPYPDCPATCKLRENCEECHAEKQQILTAISYIDDPEGYKASFKIVSGHSSAVPSKCSLCGAPLSDGASACEYCGTPAAASPGGKRIVSSAAEIGPPEMEAYDLMYNRTIREIDSPRTLETIKLTSIISAALSSKSYRLMGVKPPDASFYEKASLNAMKIIRQKMTLSDIHFMASEYNLSVSNYLRALFDGDPNIKTAPVYRQEKRMKEQSEMQQRQHEANMEAQRKIHEQRMQSNREYWERQRALYRPPQYGSGVSSSSCCGSCVHYMSGSNECAYSQFHHPSSASDYCVNYRSR